MKKLISYLIRGIKYFNLNAQTESPILNEQKTLICIFLRWKNFRKKKHCLKVPSVLCLASHVALSNVTAAKKFFCIIFGLRDLKRGVEPNKMLYVKKCYFWIEKSIGSYASLKSLSPKIMQKNFFAAVTFDKAT